ncbi:hypothetical protein [Stenotrophomonas nematodicola]|uniref:Transmembrane protein n=1 Tax=Stenotrophomonas nematodicola TaxID=2656746 RepID=A0ABW7CWJ1_9GAMM
MRGWILMMVLMLGVAVPAMGSARECRAGQPVPDRQPSRVAAPPTAAAMQAHVLACQRLAQRNQALRPWLAPLKRTLGLGMVGGALLAVLALLHAWRSRRRSYAHVPAFVALHCLALWLLLDNAMALYRGVMRHSMRGRTHWIWYDLSPATFTVQQCANLVLAITALVIAWVVVRGNRPPRAGNPLPRRGPRRR